jgi:hypothetical protein
MTGFSAGGDRAKARLPQRPALRTLSYDNDGDGVVFLRSRVCSPEALMAQWESVRDLLLDRPLVPRIVIAACGFDGDLAPDGRVDLLLLLESVRQGWCHWVATTDLERLCYRGPIVRLLGGLGVEVYISDEDLANPLPMRCHSCRSPRADVRSIGRFTLCTDCREQVDCRTLLVDLAHQRDRIQKVIAETDFDDVF